ncbi:hypothetical protein V8F33_003446 [Rhypophila sp. PSN 637]
MMPLSHLFFSLVLKTFATWWLPTQPDQVLNVLSHAIITGSSHHHQTRQWPIGSKGSISTYCLPWVAICFSPRRMASYFLM